MSMTIAMLKLWYELYLLMCVHESCSYDRSNYLDVLLHIFTTELSEEKVLVL